MFCCKCANCSSNSWPAKNMKLSVKRVSVNLKFLCKAIRFATERTRWMYRMQLSQFQQTGKWMMSKTNPKSCCQRTCATPNEWWETIIWDLSKLDMLVSRKSRITNWQGRFFKTSKIEFLPIKLQLNWRKYCVVCVCVCVYLTVRTHFSGKPRVSLVIVITAK